MKQPQAAIIHNSPFVMRLKNIKYIANEMQSRIASKSSVVREKETNDQFPVHNDHRTKLVVLASHGIRGIAVTT